MKIVASGVVISAVLVGLAGTAFAQSTNSSGSVNGGQGGAQTNSAGVVGGTATGTGTGTGVTPNTNGIGMTGNVHVGPALNTMRANGTSLNQSPNPRAPNVAGRPAPSR